jgi:hypothetical protein
MALVINWHLVLLSIMTAIHINFDQYNTTCLFVDLAWVGGGRKMLSEKQFSAKFREMLRESFPKIEEACEIGLEQLQDFLEQVEKQLSHRYMVWYKDSYPGKLFAYLTHAGYKLSDEITEWFQPFLSRRVERRI